MKFDALFRRPGSILFLALLMTTMIACSDTEGDHPHGEDAHHEEASHDDHHDEEGHEEDGHDDEHQSGGTISLPEDELVSAGIEVGAPLTERVRRRITAPAVVTAINDSRANAGSIVPGRVTRVWRDEGDAVRRGSPLVSIESFAVGEARAAVIEARAREELAASALERQKALAGEEIGAGRSLDEATAEYRRAVAARKSAEARLRSMGVRLAEDAEEISNQVIVRSPISGVVSKRTVVVGEYVAAEEELFSIVNVGRVWVDAQVPVEHASRLRTGEAGFVNTAGGERVSGPIVYISPTVDEESRTVIVRMEVTNQGGELPPGAYATAEFHREVTGSAVTIPESALERSGGRHFVYVQTAPGTFVHREILIGGEVDDKVIVEQGLEEAETIATDGIFYLRSVREAGSLAEHHH